MNLRSLRKIAACIVLAGAAVTVTGGAAAAAGDPLQAQYWHVEASYPNTTQGRYDCNNAVNNFPWGMAQCLVDSDNTAWINLWVNR